MYRPLAALALAAALATPAAADKAAEDAFVRARLIDAVRLMDEAFRVPETGQYRDFVRIGRPEADQRYVSSIAATGIGLASLAIGDALGAVDGAEDKAADTLRALLGDGPDGFHAHRSASGWYQHFIDARTGEAIQGSQGRVSTIDTALLAAGAGIAARYFDAVGFAEGRGGSDVARLADALIDGVDWSGAIHRADRGLIHLVFKGEEETPLDGIYANPFDEYALLPCIAMKGEEHAGVIGPAHDLFIEHYARAEELPMIDVGEVSVVSKPSGATIAHFTHQFAFYWCEAFARQTAWRDELRELAEADRAWFAARFDDTALWGLGAGSEVKWNEDGTVDYTGYGVNHLMKNPHDTASPAIMAGFAGAYESGEAGDPLPDLMALWEAGTCRYEHEGLGFLWRCSARDPSVRVGRVEAVDFSTYVLGLAARDPALGMRFFSAFGL